MFIIISINAKSIFFEASGETTLDTPERTLTGHSHHVVDLSWAPDGSKIASASADDTAKIWDITTGNILVNFDKHSGGVYSVAWSPDGTKVATSGGDNLIRVWNPNNGVEIDTLSGHTAPPASISWSPDGSKIVSGSSDSTIRIWNMTTYTSIKTINLNYFAQSVEWSNDGSKIAAGLGGGKAKVWNANTYSEITTFDKHHVWVTHVSFSPDSSKIASSDQGDVVRIWNSTTGAEIGASPVHQGGNGPICIAWSPNNNLIGSSGASSSKGVIWFENNYTKFISLIGHTKNIRSIAWSSNGLKIATGAANNDNSIKIWDLSPYLNNPPTKPSFDSPTEINVLRNNSATLSAISSDEKTPAGDLEPEYQHKLHSNLVWSNSFFSQPSFSSGKWHIDFKPNLDAELGWYDFRVRFKDDSNSKSEWTTIENAVKVLNNLPEITSRSDIPTQVYRGQYASFEAKVTDLEDNSPIVPVQCELSPSGQQEWSSYLFSPPTYNTSSNRWKVEFFFPINSTLGLYDLRLKCTDSDGNSSIWHYVNNSISVLNNVPYLTEFSIWLDEIKRGENTIIYVTASDFENSGDINTPILEVKGPASSWQNVECSYNFIGDNFTGTFVTGPSSELGKYSCKVKLTDKDNSSSSWVYYNDTLTVRNNPPVIHENFENISVYNDKYVLIDLSSYAIDYEDSSNTLTWKVVEYSPTSLFVADMKNETVLEISPLSTEKSGIGKIQFLVKDSDGGAFNKNITVEILNTSEKPNLSIILNSPDNSSTINTASINLTWSSEGYAGDVTYNIYYGDSIENMGLEFSDVQDNRAELSGLKDNLTYYWRITAKIEGVPTVFKSDVRHFTVHFSFVPQHRILMYFNDANVEVPIGDSILINITMENTGNVDEDVILEVVGELNEYVSIDPDISLNKGGKRTIELKVIADRKLEQRIYNLTISASYSGLVSTASININMLEEEKSVTEDKKSEVWTWFIIAAILFLSVVAVLIFVFTKKKKTEEDRETLNAEIESKPIPGITSADLDRISISGGQFPQFQGRLSYNLPGQQSYQHKPLAPTPQVTLPQLKITRAVGEQAKALPQSTGFPPGQPITSTPIPSVALLQSPGATTVTPPAVPALPVVGSVPTAPITPSVTVAPPGPTPTTPVPTAVPAVPPVETLPVPPSNPMPPPDAAPFPPPEAEIGKSTTLQAGLRKKPSFLDVKHTMLFKLGESMPCSICYGNISEGLQAIRCNCGNISHLSCGIKVGKCHECGNSYRIIIDSASEEAIIQSVEDSQKTAKREVKVTVEWNEGEDLMLKLLKQVINKEITVEEYKTLSADLKHSLQT